VICWLHVLFCSVWNLVISLHWPIMDHLSHQLKVFSHWNPKVRSTLTHPGPVAHIPYTVSPSRALQHSSPDNPKPRSFTSGSGASEFQAAQYVGHSEHINAVRARQPMGISVSCLISVHVRFRCCGLFTGDFLLACFVTTACGRYCYLWVFHSGTSVHLLQIENQSEKQNTKTEVYKLYT